MYNFKHEFRELQSTDGYDGCLDLCTGDKPLICEIVSEDDSADILISGVGMCDSCKETIVTISYEDNEYILILPNYNTLTMMVADFIADKLETGKDDLHCAINTVAEELGMMSLH